MDLLDYVIRSSEAKTIEELHSLLRDGLSDLCGLKYYIFCLETDHRCIDLPASHGVLTNYPSDWLKHYAEKGYYGIDAVRRFGRTSYGAFAWKDIPPDYFQAKISRACHSGGQEAGMRHGVCVPMRGPFGQLAGMAAASDCGTDCEHPHKLAIFNVISQQFYTRFIEILKCDDEKQKPMPILAPREKDIMAWAARGKTNAEISDILSLSPNYVREIVSTVMRKYNSSNRVAAVLTAIFNGEIGATELVERPFYKKSAVGE